MEQIKLREQWKEACHYLKESQNFVYFVFAVFLICVLIGIIFVDKFSIFNIVLRQLANRALDFNFVEMIFFILQNNLYTSLLGMIAGIILGVFPFVNTAINGVLVGYVLERVVSVGGASEIWKLLPHGIFELPAVFIALGIGIKLGFFIFTDRPLTELKRRFYNSANVFLMIVIPLLIIAAVIEGLLIAFYN